MATPIPAPEPEPVISATPRPVKDKTSETYKPVAAVLFRALRSRGEAGLSWRECWMVLEEAASDVAVGPLIIWMRSKGVGILATYRDGETVFVWEEPPVAPTPSGE